MFRRRGDWWSGGGDSSIMRGCKRSGWLGSGEGRDLVVVVVMVMVMVSGQRGRRATGRGVVDGKERGHGCHLDGGVGRKWVGLVQERRVGG